MQVLTAGPDLGSEAFMRARVGLGVFIFEAAEPGQPTPSKWMLHQAANDGFRGLYLRFESLGFSLQLLGV